ncbi:unnamed protein product [Merluccius merluccius]
MDEKYRNQTCGLCGDYNGVQIYDELFEYGELVDIADFGEHWKVNDPTEKCMEVSTQNTAHCPDQKDLCTQLLSDPAFHSCKGLLDSPSFVEACVKDLCHCNISNTCLCPTLSEYSRQCAHAGGTPERWETAQQCG